MSFRCSAEINTVSNTESIDVRAVGGQALCSSVHCLSSCLGNWDAERASSLEHQSVAALEIRVFSLTFNHIGLPLRWDYFRLLWVMLPKCHFQTLPLQIRRPQMHRYKHTCIRSKWSTRPMRLSRQRVFLAGRCEQLICWDTISVFLGVKCQLKSSATPQLTCLCSHSSINLHWVPKLLFCVYIMGMPV